MTVVYVAVGSALGGVCRYFVSALLNSPSGFPWGTLGVNVLGSLVIGLVSGWLAHGAGNAAAIRAFYLSLGAEPMKDWTVYRIAGQALTDLAETR